jgi:hypothetical protein
MERSKKILTALNNVMAKVSYVQKNGENKFHGYRYASEADLLEKLRPVMIEEGLILIPSVEMVRPIDDFGNTVVDMKYTLAHKDGDVWPEPIRISGCGNDRNKSGNVGDKGVYKAITGANKYLLFKLFQIETGDDPENDEASHTVTVQVAGSGGSGAQVSKKQASSVPDAKFIADPNKSPEENLETYVAVFKSVVDNIVKTPEDAKEWWQNNEAARKELGIMHGDVAHLEMHDYVTKRFKELKAKKGK